MGDGEFITVFKTVQGMPRPERPLIILGDLKLTGFEAGYNVFHPEAKSVNILNLLDARLDGAGVVNETHYRAVFEKRNDALALATSFAARTKPRTLVVVGALHVRGVTDRLTNTPDPSFYPTLPRYPFEAVDSSADTVTLF